MRPCRRLGMGRCCWTCFAQIVCCSLLCMVQNWYLQAQGCYIRFPLRCSTPTVDELGVSGASVCPVMLCQSCVVNSSEYITEFTMHLNFY